MFQSPLAGVGTDRRRAPFSCRFYHRRPSFYQQVSLLYFSDTPVADSSTGKSNRREKRYPIWYAPIVVRGYPLVELNQCIFDLADFAMIDEIDILKHGQRSYFCCRPGEKPGRLLCVVPNHHELVVELREEGFNSFAEFLVRPCRRSPILLVQPIWYFKGYMRHVKKILLDLRAEIAFVAEHQAVVILPSHIFQIMKVMDIGCGHVVGVYDAAHPADRVEFIAVIMHALRGTIAPLRCPLIIIASHGASFGPRILACFDGFGVDAENIFPAVYGSGNVFAYLLPKWGRDFAPLIELSAADQVGKSIAFFGFKPFEQIVLAIIAERLGSGGEGDDFEVGKLGYDAATGAVPVPVYTIHDSRRIP